MSKTWRRITSWPLILLRRNWVFLPSWLAKTWHRWGSQTSCPWWCTWRNSMRCLRTRSPPVVRAVHNPLPPPPPALCCCLALLPFLLTMSFISTPKSKPALTVFTGQCQGKFLELCSVTFSFFTRLFPATLASPNLSHFFPWLYHLLIPFLSEPAFLEKSNLCLWALLPHCINLVTLCKQASVMTAVMGNHQIHVLFPFLIAYALAFFALFSTMEWLFFLESLSPWLLWSGTGLASFSSFCSCPFSGFSLPPPFSVSQNSFLCPQPDASVCQHAPKDISVVICCLLEQV